MFDLLGLLCGAYLIWLGIVALRAAKWAAAAPVVGNPLRAGLAFGLSNPKAYPFALAMLTAVLGHQAQGIGPGQAAQLLAACGTGFVLADLIVVFWTGLPPIRRFYRRHAALIGRAMGVIFIAFGLKAGHEALASIRARG